MQIWPGVDIDVPVSAGESHCTPESVASAVKAAFKGGGVEGIILSRNYVEMKPENLSGAGRGVKGAGGDLIFSTTPGQRKQMGQLFLSAAAFNIW